MLIQRLISAILYVTIGALVFAGDPTLNSRLVRLQQYSSMGLPIKRYPDMGRYTVISWSKSPGETGDLYAYSRMNKAASPARRSCCSRTPPACLGGGWRQRPVTFFFSISSGGWEKIKLKLTALPCIFIYVVFRFNPIAFAIQREPACPSVPTIAIA